ncbi:hypothetical protein RD792_017420 [Penstemon davidsonii]|uniref:Uncharacterized protein n=1 Tax=Penstemon davidsonii TaxID=160366 RepID=A0ABR0CLY7_9LAMI|nr:hypothetical protein RD792_017412 [Penstemon davidsonii]KAK4478141.1 hypothetical protein RD792_017420 [Penstemon davidsonii]
MVDVHIYPYYSQVTYLWKAVDLRLTANVLGFFEVDHIYPDDNRFVVVSDISNAIWAKIGSVHPTIKCSGDYLVEIVICFDSFGVQVIECRKILA